MRMGWSIVRFSGSIEGLCFCENRPMIGDPLGHAEVESITRHEGRSV